VHHCNLLVVIDIVDVDGILSIEPEDHAPVSADVDSPFSFSFSFELMQPDEVDPIF